PPILYASGTSICPVKRSITLECCYCQECGELYYRGYKREVEGRGGRQSVLNAEIPMGQKREEIRQGLLYCGDEQFSEPWQEVRLNGLTGKYTTNLNRPGWLKAWALESPFNDFPSDCPNCEAVWAQRPDRVTSPIRTMGTGYHKLNQVIIEQLIGEVHEAT